MVCRMRISRSCFPRECSGFSYLLLLVIVAVLSLLGSYSVQAGHAIQRRHAEDALLQVGLEFQRALISYRRSGAASLDTAPTRGPRVLEDLLRDTRVPGLQRHLRRIPVDPLTGHSNWGLLRDKQGGIVGVFSLAVGVPIKQAMFDRSQLAPKSSRSYADWIFGDPAEICANGASNAGEKASQGSHFSHVSC
jgi:hypothetical protein